MSDWPCPRDLKAGEEIEVESKLDKFDRKLIRVVQVYPQFVTCVYPGWPVPPYQGYNFSFSTSGRGFFNWRRAEAAVTLTEMKAADPAFGAVCKRCKMYNPDTETRKDYVCYECR